MNYSLYIGSHVKFMGCSGSRCLYCRECIARAHEFVDDNGYVHGIVTGMSDHSYYIKIREDIPVQPHKEWDTSTTLTIGKDHVAPSERNREHLFDKGTPIKDEPEDFNIGEFL